MQPEVELLADGADGREGVEGSVNCGAGGGVDEEGRFASRKAFGD